jgi:RNA polymerase sigma-70 factor, ECF subfamily
MSEKLIQRWRDGDENAAEALYQAHHMRVYRLACALLGDRQDAEEVMQDALVYALTHIDRYDPQRAALSTWLHAITVSRCRDRQRRKRLSQVPLESWMGGGQDAAASAPGPEGSALIQARKNELWQALDQLSPKLREAIVLRYWGEHTYQEMGQILGCPLSTAQSRVRLAYERLRDVFKPTDLTGSTGVGVPALEGESLR